MDCRVAARRHRLLDSVLVNASQITDTNWDIVGAGDFNRDGKSDLVWHHRTEGWVGVWLMDGITLVSSVATSVERLADTNWVIRAV